MDRTRNGIVVGVSLWLMAQSGLAAIVPPLPQPSWKELKPDQQKILAPLSGEWDKMEGFRRKKWLGIAQRYQSLTPEEQARMQRRMTTWAKLTPEERKRARDQYLSLKQAPPEKKEAVKMKWEAYKELPETEKARLKAEASRKATPRPPPSKPASPPPAGKSSSTLSSPPVAPSSTTQLPTSGVAQAR